MPNTGLVHKHTPQPHKQFMVFNVFNECVNIIRNLRNLKEEAKDENHESGFRNLR